MYTNFHYLLHDMCTQTFITHKVSLPDNMCTQTFITSCTICVHKLSFTLAGHVNTNFYYLLHDMCTQTFITHKVSLPDNMCTQTFITSCTMCVHKLSLPLAGHVNTNFYYILHDMCTQTFITSCMTCVHKLSLPLA